MSYRNTGRAYHLAGKYMGSPRKLGSFDASRFSFRGLDVQFASSVRTRRFAEILWCLVYLSISELSDEGDT